MAKDTRIEKSIYKRGPNTYQVKMRDGIGGWITKTFFDAKSDHEALQKARDFRDLKRVAKSRDPDFKRIEGSAQNRRISETTLYDLLKKYKEEITPTKSDIRTETLRIEMLMRSEIAKLPADRIDGEMLRKYIDKMTWRDLGKRPISESTKVRYQVLVSHVYNIARRRWRYKLANPVEDMEKFTNNPGRERRLLNGEHEYILSGLVGPTKRRNEELQLIYLLALGTACREDEILTHSWEDLDWAHHSIYISANRSKTRTERSVPIFRQDAINLLKKHHDKCGNPKHGRIFKTSQNTLIQNWKKSLARARKLYLDDCLKSKFKVHDEFLVNLRFHDLRHEATSWLFENTDLKDLEIMQIVGHRDLQTTKRYAHLRTKHLGTKIISMQVT